MREVAEAYIAGLEDFVAKGGDPHKVASVASFFVSRIDTLVDDALDKKIAATADAGREARARSAQGQGRDRQRQARLPALPATSSATSAGSGWRSKGAQTQRLLWASTGTKNKAYSDVLYVDELIGPDTVNTMPPATMDAFRDHGKPRASLEEDVAGAQAVMDGAGRRRHLDRRGHRRSWSRTASGCSPTRPTSSTRRCRKSAARCSAASSTR